MNKEEILSQLRVAKAAHVSWVQRAKLLIEGFTINETSIPVNSTECQFGKWFYYIPPHYRVLDIIRRHHKLIIK